MTPNGPFAPGGGAAALIRRGEAEAGAWRFRLEEEGWRDLVATLARDPLPFVGLWADGQDVHALFLEGGERVLVASVAPYGGRYLGLSGVRPAASLPERCVHDLWGFEAMEARDTRPWLDHGVWTATWPLGPRPGPVSWPPDPPEFRPQPGGGTILGIGPADGGHHTPGHLRLALGGRDTVGGAEWRLGYAHRGVMARLCGLDAPAAVRLAGRAAAGASVAHQSALCRAIEAASDSMVGTGTERCRVLLAEIERVATHLHDVARTARAAGATALAAECEYLRESVMDLCGRMFGHRLLMDLVRPEGPDGHAGAGDAEDGAAIAAVARQVADLVRGRMRVVGRCRDWPGLEARVVGRGVLGEHTARMLGVGGVAGRASAREEDLRRLVPGYRLGWLDTGVRRAGDVAARIDLRLAEIGGSVRILESAGADGPLPGTGTPPRRDGEGVGCAEGPRGAVWYWVRMEGGAVRAAHVRDPALAHVAALEHVLAGADADDVAMIVRSFGLSAAAADL
ncbi:Ni Fe-hydrogenase III large subunit-like protein [Gluconacetobacter diazotrophicus PA1 5]|nr:Ni Fe-hydrogenase III large subunit-like protein [Gluconacetobacter diazotrophicus]ACI52789.1 Ni Fe-hydrogenase III large subunit-like protein [Gluconacetobacter diazotrophicus PA1 5]TWB09066.1 Ni,Fe-hydrogenase III large subunit [Gluconacetobacter diazotrophicus]